MEIMSARDDYWYRVAQGRSRLTYHILPKHAEHAHRVLSKEIALTRESFDAQQLFNETKAPDGGFSIKDHVGDGPSSGYMVSLSKADEKTYPSTIFTPEDIQEYMNQHASEINAPGNYFGAWHDPEDGNIYLDVSTNYQDYDQAVEAAKAANQLAIFDLSTFNSVFV